MKVLVLGSNGATGFNVVMLLLKNGFDIKAITRNADKLKTLKEDPHIEIIKASILEMDHQILRQHLQNVDAVISCLGHNITLKGIFGKPHLLVTDALKKVTSLISETNPDRLVKFILMNTTACINPSQGETFNKKEDLIMGIMRKLLPPHNDNEWAFDYLIKKAEQNHPCIEWIAVRPDSLINESDVSEYTVHPSPVRSPIFNAGKTSRVNVADFMVKLLNNDELWEKWKFQTPVIYNAESKKKFELSKK